MEEVTTNRSYKAKVDKASAILKSERVPPIEEAAFWINYVLRWRALNKILCTRYSIVEYLGLDIIAFC